MVQFYISFMTVSMESVRCLRLSQKSRESRYLKIAYSTVYKLQEANGENWKVKSALNALIQEIKTS